MRRLGLSITEAILMDYGKDVFLQKMSDPFWFQSLGAVMGMDWHSSGITTSVMGALKKAINPNAKALGIYVCGGKGKFSKDTPAELLKIADITGLNGHDLVYNSKLSAKVDNTMVQDGFQLYTHNFIVSDEGSWTVVQQGMNAGNKLARRYHWHSRDLKSFIEEPHTGVCGINQGLILNLASKDADQTRSSILQLTGEEFNVVINEFKKLVMPGHHDVHAKDINLKRLGSVLWLAHDKRPNDFKELVLLEGLGPRTLQSLALVSEVIHGTPSRFADPARFSFAHGGKDGHPFPVPLKVYDETIATLQTAVAKAKMGNTDKAEAIKKLHAITVRVEKDFTVTNTNFNALIEKERNESWKYGGKTVQGNAEPPTLSKKQIQLKLF